jgi:hypothetical protein
VNFRSVRDENVNGGQPPGVAFSSIESSDVRRIDQVPSVFRGPRLDGLTSLVNNLGAKSGRNRNRQTESEQV